MAKRKRTLIALLGKVIKKKRERIRIGKKGKKGKKLARIGKVHLASKKRNRQNYFPLVVLYTF